MSSSRSLRPHLLREGGETFKHTVTLSDVENAIHPFGFVAKPRVRLLQRRSFSEFRHIFILPFSLPQANFG